MVRTRIFRGLVTLLLVVGTLGIIGPEAAAQFDDENEVAGVVEAVDVQQSMLVVDGVTYVVTGETEYEGIGDLSNLSSGDEVEVEYEKTSNGRNALEVETGDVDDEEEDETGENEVSGVIEAVGDRLLTIDGTEYFVSDQTEYEGISGLSGLSSGDEVEIEYREVNGERDAEEIELASADDD